MSSVAIFFDDQPRHETTGIYCHRALQQLEALGHGSSVQHFRPREVTRASCDDVNLFIQIDDGIESHLPTESHPLIWWAIDTHVNFDYALRKSRESDLVFAAQRDGAARLVAEGIESATWLPLACDPDIQ